MSSEATPTTVRKVRSAFLFYQTEMLSKIRQEMGGNSVSMGDAMTEVCISIIERLISPILRLFRVSLSQTHSLSKSHTLALKHTLIALRTLAPLDRLRAPALSRPLSPRPTALRRRVRRGRPSRLSRLGAAPTTRHYAE